MLRTSCRIAVIFCALLAFHGESSAETFLTRTQGLAQIWEGIHRPVDDASGMPFADIGKDRADYARITFAEQRGIVDEAPRFEPDAPLHLGDALLWLLRTRNVADWKAIRYDTIGDLTSRFNILPSSLNLPENPAITQENLATMITALDTALKNAKHTVSYYSEDFRGDHTAFGEIFNPDELTAAHRTFPQGTMVRVTNTADGRSVVVRINDRGPYVDGRDMDLSRAAFEQISDTAHGVISGVTFERLGHVDAVGNIAGNTAVTGNVDDAPKTEAACAGTTLARSFGTLQLSPGIPRKASAGSAITLTGNNPFRIIIFRTPRGLLRDRVTVRPGSSWNYRFTDTGTYLFIVMNGVHRERVMVRVTDGC